MAETQVEETSAGWRGATERAARRLAAITVVGGLLGLLVGGVGGRLAMMLLARLNPSVTGPPWLTIGLFIALPGVYAALLTLLAEPLLVADSWFVRAPILLAAAPTALWIPLAPLLGILVLLWASCEGMRRTPHGATALGHPVMAWAARLGLVGVFVVSLVDLGKDAAELM